MLVLHLCLAPQGGLGGSAAFHSGLDAARGWLHGLPGMTMLHASVCLLDAHARPSACCIHST